MNERIGKLISGSPLRCRSLMALLAVLLYAAVGAAQPPIRFGTPDAMAPPPVVTPAPATYPGGVPAAPGGAVVSPSTMTPFGPAPAAGAAPTLPPGGYVAAPPGSVPAAPGTYTYGPAPMATLNGTVQPPPATWDPFAPPGPTPPVLAPAADPYYTNPQPVPQQPGPFTMPAVVTDTYRFLRDVSLDYHWFVGSGSNTNELGIHDIEADATFALPMPFFQQPQQAPLLVTPGFAWHFWDGPSSEAAGSPDMPARTYDAFLDAAWNPVIVPNAFSAELDASVGIYSDFTKITNQSLRVKGRGMAVIAIPETKLTLKAGVWYINRGKFKLLPAGGFVWQPSPVTRFDILFPNPKFTQQLYTSPAGTEWWWYLSGEYGGGVWTVKRATTDQIDLVDYNDMRVALGIDFKRCTGQTGFFEGGYAFQRELVYASGSPEVFRPNGTFYLHAGVAF